MILWIIESRMKRDEIELEISVKELYSTLLIVLSAFMLSNLSFVYRNTPFSGSIATDIFTIRTLVDFGGLAILYAYQSLRHEVGAEKELSKIQSILTAQYDSYRNYQEVTDLINMKYHDLKHQIAGLRQNRTRKSGRNGLIRWKTSWQPISRNARRVIRYWTVCWTERCR